MTNSESEVRSAARPRLAPVEAGDATPLRLGDDPYVWVSWLYYQEGMTQHDIAQTMGVSRATVNTYLNEARERGIVNIAIEPGRLASLTIAQSLRSHFSLRDCLVIPNGADDRALGDRLGAAGAMALRKFLKSGDTLAVTGDRTVMAVGDSLRIPGLQDVTVVQAIGGAIARNPASPSRCASAIASAVNATWVSLSAPSVASSVEARAIMVAEPLVAEQLSILMRANKALFGIASLRPNASLYSEGVFEAAQSVERPTTARRKCVQRRGRDRTDDPRAMVDANPYGTMADVGAPGLPAAARWAGEAIHGRARSGAILADRGDEAHASRRAGRNGRRNGKGRIGGPHQAAFAGNCVWAIRL